MAYNIVVIYGSVRSERMGIKAAKYMVKKCKECGYDTTFVDPVEYPLPLIDKMYKEYTNDDAPEILEKLAKIIKAADGYIVVSGEYNHSIPPALSNLMDYFLEEYFFKPSAIVCYSNRHFGGVRAAVQLRSFLSELGTPAISSIMPIPNVDDAFDDDGNPSDPATERRSKRFLDEFDWYVSAFKNEREKGVPY